MKMRFAITGGTGFVGRNVAAQLLEAGHDVVLIARSRREPNEALLARVLSDPRASFYSSALDDPADIARALAGCTAVAHLAGINREVGSQTYAAVHVAGTANVVEGARLAGVSRIALLSFLRARPDCGSAYHESKWAAEEIVRRSGLTHTILKSGVIYGRGDHMLDHLSHALHTFPIFGLVGRGPLPIRPVAVAEVARIVVAAMIPGTAHAEALAGRSVAVFGPEELTLAEAVARVATAVGQKPLFVPLPVAAHRALAFVAEHTMKVPLVSLAQVRILSEGLVEPAPWADRLPAGLEPVVGFTLASIRRGLPPPGPFTTADLRLPAGCLTGPGATARG